MTGQSLIELYNSDWANVGEDKERMYKTAHFLSNNSCVIADGFDLWAAEVATYPDPVSMLPVRFDLDEMPKRARLSALLEFLRGEELKKARDNYEIWKASWLKQKDVIIQHAFENGNLKLDTKGKLIQSIEEKEVFLVSLDLRLVDPQNKDILVEQYVSLRQAGSIPRLSATRLTSLCFWYLYVAVDQANRIKTRPSDMADIYHASLLPYCAAFTVDSSMERLLTRMQESILPVECELISPAKLKQYLAS